MDMLELIRSLPDQIREALGYEISEIKKPERIFICGMGGSAIAGDIAKMLVPDLTIPVEVIRDYYLPPYARQRDLLIASSYSGNTEETLAAFEDARRKGLSLFAISSGGKLMEMAERFRIPCVKIPEGYPPRAALGYLLTTVILLFKKLNIIPEETFANFEKLPDFLSELRPIFEKEDSIAVDIATKFYHRIPVIYSSSKILPVALRWKAQINENAKAFCHTMEFPEMNHNEINGIKNPRMRCEDLWVLFLVDPNENPRIKLRYEITKDLIQESIQGYTFVAPEGSNFVERTLYFVYLGDYVSYFLAKFYKEDPIAIPRITELKRRLTQ